MNIPISLSILALVTGGMARFAWKIAGSNKAYGPSYMIVETITFGLVAIVIHMAQRQPFDLSPRMTVVAALGGIAAGITVSSVLLAFRLGGQGSIIFPIAGLGVIVSVLLSFIVYREPVTTTKLLGVGFGITSIIFLSR